MFDHEKAYETATTVEEMKTALLNDAMCIRDRYNAAHTDQVGAQTTLDGLVIALEVMRDLFNQPDATQFMKRPEQIDILRVAVDELLRQYSPENRN